MFNTVPNFHPFGGTNLNAGQQGVIGSNASTLFNNSGKKVDASVTNQQGLHSLHQNNNTTSSSSLNNSIIGNPMNLNGYPNSNNNNLFYNTSNINNNSSGMNTSLFGNQPPNISSHHHSLLNQHTQPSLINNDGAFKLMNNKTSAASATSSSLGTVGFNQSSNLLRNTTNNLQTPSSNTSPFGLSLLNQQSSSDIIGSASTRNNLVGTNNSIPPMNNNTNSSSLLSSFHNDFGASRGHTTTSFQQFNNNSIIGNNNFGWNTTTSGNMNGSGSSHLLNSMSSPANHQSNFYSPFLQQNNSNQSPMNQQPHLPLFGSNSNTTDSFFGQQFTPFNQPLVGGSNSTIRTKSSTEVDFSYLTSSLPLDDDDDTFLNQTSNPLFEDTTQPFSSKQGIGQLTPSNLFNPQQSFAGVSPSNSSSGNSTNDNTTATPSPPPPQFLSSTPEYQNRVMGQAMASAQYLQSSSNFMPNVGNSNFVSGPMNGFPSNMPPYMMPPNRGNVSQPNVENAFLHQSSPYIPMNTVQKFPSNTINGEQHETKHPGSGYYVFAPPPSTTQPLHPKPVANQTSVLSSQQNETQQPPILPKQDQTKKEPEVKTVNVIAEIRQSIESSNKTVPTTSSVEKKEESKTKPEPTKTKPTQQHSKKKNAKAEKAPEIKPVEKSKPLVKEEAVKSEQEKLDEELAKKLQREFELEYLRNLEPTSNRSKNNSFTSTSKKKKTMEDVPEEKKLAATSSSNFFSILESVPAEVQQPVESKTLKKQIPPVVTSTKSSKKSSKKKKKTEETKKEEKVELEKVETKTESSKTASESNEDYNKPCRDHFKGKCKFGSGICPYSHDRSFYIKYQQEHPDEFPPLAIPKSKKKETTEPVSECSVQKKTEVCMKHSSVQSCGNGKNCKYIHLSDLSLHDLYRKYCTGHSDRICKCAPQNDPPILYIEGVTKLNKKQMQEISEKSFMKALGVFKITEQDLFTYLPELKSIPPNERKHRKFCYIFPDTCVKLVLSKIERSEANRVKKLFNETEEEDIRKRQSELAGQRYDQEKDDEIHPTWQITGLTSHQHCILRFIEERLPLCFVAPDCDHYGEGEPYDEAMYGHCVNPVQRRSVYPSILERIFEMIEPEDESDEDISKELLMMMLGKVSDKKKSSLVGCVGPDVCLFGSISK